MKVYFYDADENSISVIRSASLALRKRGCTVHINPPTDMLTQTEDAIFFIDTRLAFPCTAFALAASIRKTNELCHIIFMTAHIEDWSFCMEHLIRPSALILKPLSESAILTKVTEILSYKNRDKNRGNEKIFISTHTVKRSLDIKKILYFATFGKKIVCKTDSGESILFYATMKELEQKYAADFIRCHSGFLANKQAILGLCKGALTLRNCADTLPVSKKYSQAVRNFLKEGA